MDPYHQFRELPSESLDGAYIDILCGLAIEYNDKLAKKLVEAKAVIREIEDLNSSDKSALKEYNEIEISSLIDYFKKTSSPLKKLAQQMSSAIEDLNLSSGKLIEFDIRLAELEYHIYEVEKIRQKLNSFAGVNGFPAVSSHKLYQDVNATISRRGSIDSSLSHDLVNAYYADEGALFDIWIRDYQPSAALTTKLYTIATEILRENISSKSQFTKKWIKNPPFPLFKSVEKEKAIEIKKRLDQEEESKLLVVELVQVDPKTLSRIRR